MDEWKSLFSGVKEGEEQHYADLPKVGAPKLIEGGFVERNSAPPMLRKMI